MGLLQEAIAGGIRYHEGRVFFSRTVASQFDGYSISRRGTGTECTRCSVATGLALGERSLYPEDCDLTANRRWHYCKPEWPVFFIHGRMRMLPPALTSGYCS